MSWMHVFLWAVVGHLAFRSVSQINNSIALARTASTKERQQDITAGLIAVLVVNLGISVGLGLIALGAWT